VNSSIAVQSSEEDFWEICRNALRELLGENSYLTWIDTLRFLGVHQNSVNLGVMNQLHRDWLERYYHEEIVKVIREQIGEEVVVRYCADEDARPVPELKLNAPCEAVKSIEKATPPPKEPRTILPELSAAHSFESFIVGDCNRMAYSASITVAEHPGVNQFNPLILYGPSGTGKTHLLQAIARHASEHRTAARIVYRTSDQFIKDFMAAVQSRRFLDFNRIYEGAEILIIDDIQFFAGKEGTQEALFKLFSRTLSFNQQIVLSCDQLPAQIEHLDRKLLSRLEGGLCCAIDMPDTNTRLAILKSKACAQGMNLKDDTLSWLAEHFRTNVRELEGILVNLVGLRDLMGLEPTLDNIRAIMGDVVRQKGCAISVASIKEKVASAFGINVTLLSAATRIQGVSLPRKVAMYLCRELTDHSLQSIGLEFQRDYSTVLAAVKSVSKLMETDENLRARVDSLRISLLH